MSTVDEVDPIWETAEEEGKEEEDEGRVKSGMLQKIGQQQILHLVKLVATGSGRLPRQSRINTRPWRQTRIPDSFAFPRVYHTLNYVYR